MKWTNLIKKPPLLILILILSGCSTETACIKEICFAVEIADSQTEQARGLMQRASLPKGSGMLFVFKSEGIHHFWMKDTLIPLDIIWIDKQGKIIAIEKAEPCESDPCPIYGPDVPSTYVLEIQGGQSALHGFAPGDEVDISYID